MGMKVTDFKVGQKLYVDGEVSIRRITSENSEDYASESMELQFTKARVRENKDHGNA
jgi:hypothetical protein